MERVQAVSHPEPGSAAPDVSVVVPVLDEEQDIGRLLTEILHQEAPPAGFEILVVDGGSTDRTLEIVSQLATQHPNLRLLDNPRRLSSAGRNIGVRAAHGEYVLFLDGHCMLPRQDYLVRLVEIFRNTGASCLCRPQPLMSLAAWGQAIAAARHSPMGHNPGSDIYKSTPAFTDPRSAGAAYDRRVLVELGGYDERFDACEDVEFNHRVAQAGFKSYRHPDLAVRYRPRDSLGALYRQMCRYGRGRARLLARHPTEIPWTLVGMTSLALLLVAMPFAGGGHAAVLFLILVAGLWTLAAGVESVRLAGFSMAVGRILAAFAAIHLGLLLGFWRGLVEFKRFRHPRQASGREAWAEPGASA
jgi:succinoglycan biosynthesis protein ExoA